MKKAILQHTRSVLQHGTQASSQFSPTLCGPCWVVYAEPPALDLSPSAQVAEPLAPHGCLEVPPHVSTLTEACCLRQLSGEAVWRGAAPEAAALIFVAHHFQRGPKVPLVGFTPGGSSTPPHHCTLLGALGCRWRKSGGSSPRMLICRGAGGDEGWVGRAGRVGGKNSTDAYMTATEPGGKGGGW